MHAVQASYLHITQCVLILSICCLNGIRNNYGTCIYMYSYRKNFHACAMYDIVFARGISWLDMITVYIFFSSLVMSICLR